MTGVLLLVATSAAGLETFTPPLRSSTASVLACVAQNLGTQTISVEAHLRDGAADVATASADVPPGQTVELVSTSQAVTAAYCRFVSDGDPQLVRGFLHQRSVAGGDSLHVFPATKPSGAVLAMVQTVTPPVRNIGNDTLLCQVQNVSDQLVSITAELVDQDGTVLVSHSDNLPAGRVRTFTIWDTAVLGGYCRFTFMGNPNQVRGYATTYDPTGSNDTHLLLAATQRSGGGRPHTLTPPLSSPPGHATACLVQNLDPLAIDVSAELIDQTGAVLDTGMLTVQPGQVRSIAGQTDGASQAVCRFNFSRAGSLAQGYITQFPPGLFADTRLMLPAYPPSVPHTDEITTVTPPVRSLDGTFACAIINLTEVATDVRVEIDDGTGIFVGLTQTVEAVPEHATFGLVTNQDTQDGVCRFTFRGRADAILGFAMLLSPPPGRTKLLLPASELGSAAEPVATATVQPSRTPIPTKTNVPTKTATAAPTFTASASPSPTATATATATHTNVPTNTALPSVTPTSPPAPSATATATRTATTTATPTMSSACAGDCDQSGDVSVDELVTMANIALGARAPDDCPAGDVDGDGTITIDEIVVAVAHALNGCA